MKKLAEAILLAPTARYLRGYLPAPIRGYLEKKHFKDQLRNLKATPVLQCKSNSSGQAFCIVHWNAPDFLLLNVKQLEALHPESKIYVLDNGSEKTNLYATKKSLKQFDNITLFFAKPEYSNHTIGLQFLLNYSAQQSDEIAVFLDQDCILSNNIKELAAKLSDDLILIGARDYVVIPKEYGPLKPGKLRKARHLVHASFMILQPNRVRELFGNHSFFHQRVRGYWEDELYHGISYNAQGRILFLETRMHDEIPILTSYLHQGVTYAWHAWYSSTAVKLSDKDFLDSLPVSWLREVRRLAYNYMKQIHEDTLVGKRNEKRLLGKREGS